MGVTLPPPPDAPAAKEGGSENGDLVEGGSDSGDVVEVTMFALAFQPNAIDIAAGTTVRWTNLDSVPHTVTEGDSSDTDTPEWDSPLLGYGEIFERTFSAPGEWIYYCRTHANVMRNNRIVVQ